MYTKDVIEGIVDKQREYFKSGETLDVNFRIRMLKRLKAMLLENEELIEDAMAKDLGRAKAEAYFCDIGSVVMEINETIRGLKRWARPETHFSGFACFPGLFTKVYKMPYGVSLIISPFNFPFMLSLGVLTASIAGGNTAVIKASSKSAESTRVLKEIIAKTYEDSYITVIDGGHDVADMCLEARFDKIFYTGSPKVAKHVMELAAKNLTPVALELGGETGNWAIVREDADIKDAARKIAFFKILNSGQICININQVAVEEGVADAFVEELKKAIFSFMGEKQLENAAYPKLISKAAYEKCKNEAIEYKDRIVYGGNGDEATDKFETTIIYPIGIDEPIVQHELFCPLLPIVVYKRSEVDNLLSTIADREHGLALYLFTKNKSWAKRVMSTQQYGGGCVNEVCVHIMAKGVPFGGTGHSGMGSYHGRYGFEEFTHRSSVLYGNTHFNLSLREHPYTEGKLKILRLFEK